MDLSVISRLFRTAAASACVIATSGISLPAHSITYAARSTPATEVQVRHLVAASAALTRVPGNVVPPIASIPDDGAYTSPDCQLKQAATTNGPCIFGDKTGLKSIVLWGDSHAGMWFPALDLMAKRIHWKLILLSKPACPIPELSFWDQQDDRPNTECTIWRRYAIKRINAMKPDLLVMTSGSYHQVTTKPYTATAAQWYTGLKSTFRQLTGPKHRVLLGELAYLTQSAPDCLAAHENDVQTCDTLLRAALRDVWIPSEERAARETGTAYIHTVPWICSAVCTPIVGNLVVFRDRFHITATYAEYLTGVVQHALGLD